MLGDRPNITKGLLWQMLRGKWRLDGNVAHVTLLALPRMPVSLLPMPLPPVTGVSHFSMRASACVHVQLQHASNLFAMPPCRHAGRRVWHRAQVKEDAPDRACGGAGAAGGCGGSA